jgi:hypothetical protein
MMRTTTALIALLTAAAVSSHADDKQAYLGVFAETTSMKIVGMAMPAGLPAGIKLPAGVKLPAAATNALKMFQPHRTLTVRLWSPGIAPDSATASLAVPDTLKLGPKLDLDLYRPKPSEGTVGGAGGPDGGVNAEMTIKRYWGSSATVKPGQPEVIEFKGLSADQQALMQASAAKMRRSTSYFYKPDWTTGYWPTQNQPGAVEDDAALTGHYALSSSYSGNVELEVPSNVNFLAPIEMSSPKLEKVIDLGDAITFRWSGIPNALGLHANIFGMNQDAKTIIMWSSSEAKPDMGVNYDYLEMSEVRDLVKKDMVMAGDRVDVTVPAGIFKDADMVMFQMIGYGPGAATDKGQPLPRVQTKTTLMIMLGGKKMPKPGRGGFPGGDGQ